LEAQLYDWPPPDRDPRVSLPITHATLDGSFHGAVPEFKLVVIFAFAMLMSSLVIILSKHKGKTGRTFEPAVGLKQALLAYDEATEQVGQAR
jgi:hypothetical protein